MILIHGSFSRKKLCILLYGSHSRYYGIKMDNIPWHGLLLKLLSFSSSLFRLLEGVWLGHACKVISSQYLDVPEFLVQNYPINLKPFKSISQ